MKRLNLRSERTVCALMAAILIACAGSCSAPPSEVETPESLTGPDLVIEAFELGDPSWTLSGGIVVDAEVVVKNVGGLSASGFDVAIVSTNRENKHVKLGFSYDPSAMTTLDGGQEVVLVGETGLGWHGNFDVCCDGEQYDATCCALRDDDTLWLTAIADYCDKDEMPEYCAVEEVDETNNTNGPIGMNKPE